MTVRMNGEVLAVGTIVELAQVPSQFVVFEDGCLIGIRFEWPDNPNYIPQVHGCASGGGMLRVEVPLFDSNTKQLITSEVLIDGKKYSGDSP